MPSAKGSDTITVSRHLIHKTKVTYWLERRRFGAINRRLGKIRDTKTSGGEAATSALLSHRLTVAGRSQGIEIAAKLIGIDLDRDVAPFVLTHHLDKAQGGKDSDE